MIGAGARTVGEGRRGFSLLELVFVVAILGVMAAIAAPRYSRSISRYRADAAARRIAADLALARRSARLAGAARTMTFSANTYTIADVPGLKDASADYRVDLSESPYEARIVSAGFGTDAKVVFDGYGVPDSGGAVKVQVGDAAKTVVLDAQSGRATVQ